jgi:Mg2+ and Co2+ transporter CorA
MGYSQRRYARADGGTATKGFDLAGTIGSIGTAIGAIFTGAGAIWGGKTSNQQDNNGSYSLAVPDQKSSSGTWIALSAVGLVIVVVLVYFIVKKKK